MCELGRHCRENKILAVDAALEARRLAALVVRRVAVAERDRVPCIRLAAAIGSQSLWRGDIHVNRSPVLFEVSLSGWDVNPCDVEVF